MRYKENIDIFINKCSESNCVNIFTSNGLNVLTYPDIPQKIKHQLINAFNLSIDECILFVLDIPSENKFEKGLVVTNYGISFKSDKEEGINWLFWNEIEHVKFENGILFFYGYDNKLDILSIDFSVFVKDLSIIQTIGSLFSQILEEIAVKNTNNVSVVDDNENEETDVCQEVLDHDDNLHNTTLKVRRYPKYQIVEFKENTISKLKNILIIWSVIIFVCFSIGGILMIIPIILSGPIIILFFKYLSLINKDYDYWELEYSKLWKNLSDRDKLKTVGRIAGVIFKLFG